MQLRFLSCILTNLILNFYQGLIYKSGDDFTAECIRVTCTMIKLRPTWIRVDSNAPIHSCAKGKQCEIRPNLESLDIRIHVITCRGPQTFLTYILFLCCSLLRMHHRLPMSTWGAL